MPVLIISDIKKLFPIHNEITIYYVGPFDENVEQPITLHLNKWSRFIMSKSITCLILGNLESMSLNIGLYFDNYWEAWAYWLRSGENAEAP